MSETSTPTADDTAVTKASPAEVSDPLVRQEIRKAAVWLAMAGAIVLAALLAQPLLLIIGALVFSSLLDGGVRLLGRVLPIGRGWRLLIVCLLAVGAAVWLVTSLGMELATQASQLRSTVEAQVMRLMALLHGWGFSFGASNLNDIAKQVLGSFGKVTAALGTAVGAVSSFVMIIVLGIFIAIEPKLYERGVAWMLPQSHRADFQALSADVGRTLRRLLAGRLLGMLVEGVFVGVALTIGGVPMAVLLGVITGLLAFIPNIGAVISGLLTVLVGFSAGVETGLWATGAYFIVQMIDGYLIVPVVARRSVDLAPALVLAAQLLIGSLFGILGLALADPIVATIKIALEHRSRKNDAAGLAEDPLPAAATPH